MQGGLSLFPLISHSLYLSASPCWNTALQRGLHWEPIMSTLLPQHSPAQWGVVGLCSLAWTKSGIMLSSEGGQTSGMQEGGWGSICLYSPKATLIIIIIIIIIQQGKIGGCMPDCMGLKYCINSCPENYWIRGHIQEPGPTKKGLKMLLKDEP